MLRSLSLAFIAAVLMTAAVFSQTRTPASQLAIEQTTPAPPASAQLFALVNGRLFALQIGPGLQIEATAGGALQLTAAATPPAPPAMIRTRATLTAEGLWRPLAARPPSGRADIYRNGLLQDESDFSWTPAGELKPLTATDPADKIEVRYYPE